MNSDEIRSVISDLLYPLSLEQKGVDRKRILDNSAFLDIPAVKVAKEIELMHAEGLLTKTVAGTGSYYNLA